MFAFMTDPVDLALGHLAERTSEPLTLAELAEAAGLSPFHFARMFAARVGEAPMAHVRRHRLLAAADRLAVAPHTALAELALDVGFESQPAFTRAFKRMFGVTPGAYRRLPFHLHAWRKPMDDHAPALRLEDTGLRSRPSFRVIGARVQMTETDKSQIPEAWARLFSLARPGPIETFGVMWAGGQGVMHYLAGYAPPPDAPAPKGLETVEVPAAIYLTFRQILDDTPVPAQVKAAVVEIWGRRAAASGYKLARGPDLEVYPAGFAPGEAGAFIEYWLPVEP